MSILPPADRREPSHQARWLWRTLRAAELADQAPAQVLAAAVSERDLARPWSAQVHEIAALMDARKDRIGEHAAEHAPPWVVTALGPVPEDPLDRLDWQGGAAPRRARGGTC